MIPSLAQWVKGYSIAIAAAQIQSLAWEFPYTAGVAIKKKKNLIKKKKISTYTFGGDTNSLQQNIILKH